MSSASLIDHYNTQENFVKTNIVPSNPSSNQDEFRQKLLDKIELDRQNDTSFLDTLEKLRHEQRLRLAQVEHDYYNQKSTSPPDVQNERIQETIVTSKPPLPKASKQSPSSPVLLTEERAQYHLHRRPVSESIVRRHDDEIAFCPHRTTTGNISTTVHDLTTEHVRKQIQSMWKEFDLEDYLDEKKNRHSATSASWAGRITIPEPFALTNSMNMDSVHRRKCMQEIEAAKLQKQIQEELVVYRPFKANPVPAHVHMPLYEQLQREQHVRSEQVRQMSRQYLNSIQKPFDFDAREKAKKIFRRHSYSGGDILRPGSQFKARPLPNFYAQPRQDHELMKEQELYRSLRKEMRSKQLLRQSRLPFSSEKSKRKHRSMSVQDLVRTGLEEYSFKPKINGYYVPNFDKLHSTFIREMEQKKRTRSPTKCKPFLLYTNLIPSKKDKILDDIRTDEEFKHAQTFQIKGKQMPTKSSSIVSVSASFQQAEAIPTKTTEAQRLREAVGRKKRQDEAGKKIFRETHQRSQSAKERRVRETIRERAKLNDQAILAKANRDERNRQMRQSIRRSEDDYAKKLDDMKARVQQRPLLLEIDERKKAVRDLKKKIDDAMKIAHVTDHDLLQYQTQTN